MESVTSRQEDRAESSQRCALGTPPSPPRREHAEAWTGEGARNLGWRGIDSTWRFGI